MADTVYGICCRASEEAACAEIARLKGRDPSQPSSVLFADLAAARALARDLRADALLGTGATLIVPNPAGRYPWLCGATPDRIGLRFAALDPRLAAVLAPLGPLLATSANVPE